MKRKIIMRKSVHLLSILFLFLITTSALQSFGQNGQITGKVIDAGNGETLPGVSIIVKNTTIGTTTDMEGMYSIEAVVGSELVFSFVGYEQQTIAVVQQRTIDVELVASYTGLDEVVVVGYGVQRKSDVTGATTSIGEKEFNPGVLISPGDMMKGRISGVQVTSNSGEPGAGATVRIRGNSSIRGNQDPLYVIDGVAITSSTANPSGLAAAGIDGSSNQDPLNFLNPEDIETITVLKDASATAIYGSRGSNGVILITTKKGEVGVGKLTYSAYASVSTLPKKLDLLTKSEFMAASSANDFGLTDLGANTDWQDEIFRSAYTQSHNLSYSGGTEKSNYYTSFGYIDQQGIINKSGLTKYNGLFKSSKKLFNDKLTISTNVSISRIENTRAPFTETGGYEGDLLISALRGNPTFPVFNTDGTYHQHSPTYRNPVAMIDLTNDNTITDRVLGNFEATYEIMEGLTYKFNVGYDNTNATRKVTQNDELNYLVNGGQASISNVEIQSVLMENYLTYTKQLNEDHNFTFLLGQSYQKFDDAGYGVVVDGFQNVDIDYINNLGYGEFSTSDSYSFRSVNELQSFYGRLNYNYREKYLLTATFRSDGSTRFGENNKYGYFPSVGAAWRLIEEDFIKDIDVIENLKLRVGYGATGNQEIPNKISLLSIGTTASANYFFDGQNITNGTTFIRTPNPDIKWETTTQANIGLDFGFFSGKLSGSVDYFNKSTKDVLLLLTSQAPAPTSTQWTNVKDMRIINSGFEVDLTGIIIDKGDLFWSTNLNFSTIHNEVVDLPVDLIQTGVASGAGLSGTRVQVIKTGYSIGTFWGKQFLGYAADGTSIYKKDADGKDVEEDLGSALPKFTIGLNNTFTYKRFDLSFFFNGVFGNKVYNNTANALFSVPSFSKGNNMPADYLRTGESDNNTPEFSSRYIENGSFIRLSTLSLGYQFDLKETSAIKSLRLYVTGSNLFLITKYSGYDPEVNTTASFEGVPSIGMDYTGYPKASTIQFGVNVQF